MVKNLLINFLLRFFFLIHIFNDCILMYEVTNLRCFE